MLSICCLLCSLLESICLAHYHDAALLLVLLQACIACSGKMRFAANVHTEEESQESDEYEYEHEPSSSSARKQTTARRKRQRAAVGKSKRVGRPATLLQCYTCKEWFTTTALIQHGGDENNAKQGKIPGSHPVAVCDECGRGFTQPRSVDQHKDAKACGKPASVRPAELLLKCASCPLVLGCAALQQHGIAMNALTPGQHPVVITSCQCKQGYTNPSSAKNHQCGAHNKTMASHYANTAAFATAEALCSSDLKLSDAIAEVIGDNIDWIAKKCEVRGPRPLTEVLAFVPPEDWVWRKTTFKDVKAMDPGERVAAAYLLMSKHQTIGSTGEKKLYFGESGHVRERLLHTHQVADSHHVGFQEELDDHPLTDEHWQLWLMTCASKEEARKVEEWHIAYHYGERHRTDMYHKKGIITVM